MRIDLKDCKMTLRAICALIVVVMTSPILSAQEHSSDNTGGREWSLGFVTSAGTGIYGSESNTDLWLSGIRLENPLSGIKSLEYVLEIDPAFIVFQDHAIYGFGVTPLLFRWTVKPENQTSAYFEIGAGALFTSSGIPQGISRLNFTPQGAVGVRWKRANNHAISLGLQYIHISSAGLEKPNPGINTLLVQFVYTWFR